jgi:hypothetical protein
MCPFCVPSSVLKPRWPEGEIMTQDKQTQAMASPEWGTSRRDFLSAAGALVVSVTGALPSLAVAQSAATPATAGAAGATGAALAAAIGAVKPALKADELDSWVAIEADGKVTAYYGKVDLGQSLDVAIGQIVAEELDVAYNKVKVVMGDSANSMNQGGASSALGIQAGAKPLLAQCGGRSPAHIGRVGFGEIGRSRRPVEGQQRRGGACHRCQQSGQLCRVDRWQILQQQGRVEQAYWQPTRHQGASQTQTSF